jgi:hypothetical protein
MPEKMTIPNDIYSLKKKATELVIDNQSLKTTIQQIDNRNALMITKLYAIKRALSEIVKLSPNAIKEFEMLCRERVNTPPNKSVHQEIDLSQEIDMLLDQLRLFMKYLLLSDEAGKREIVRIKKKDKP